MASPSAFADGFETGNLSNWTGSASMTAQQQVVHSGGWAARATSAGKAAYAYKSLGTGYQEVYYRIFFNLLSHSSTVGLLGFRTASSSTILGVGVTSTSKLFSNNPLTKKTVLGPSVGAGVWHELQVHVLVNGASSREDVWLDGTVVPALSRPDTLGSTPVGRIDLGDHVSRRTFDVAFDDVALDPSFIDTAPPSVPTGLVVSSYSDHAVDLSWDPASDGVGVTGYTIFRSDDGGHTYDPVGTSAGTHYTDAGLSVSTTFSYVVDAFDGAGNHSVQSTSVEVTTLATPDTKAPLQPDGLSAGNVSAREVDVSWNPSSDDVGVTGYTIRRSGDGVNFTTIGTSATTSYADTSVSASTPYSYAVEAFDGAGNHSLQSAPITVTTPAGFATPIRHVVIIYQENHSFDNVLGKLCSEIGSGAITGHQPCDGATSATLSSGQTIALAPATDVVPNVDHSVAGQSTAIDGGKMDAFDRLRGCDATAGYACYSQFDALSGPCGQTGVATCIPNLATLAENYVISDRTFEFAGSPSWGGHMVLASSTLDGFTGDNPKPSSFTTQKGPGWGCDSYLDAQWWDGVRYVTEPSCVPDAAGNGPYRSSPVPYVPTIFDRLDAAGLNWKIYGGGGSVDGGAGWGWSICPTFYECIGSSQRTNLVNNKNVLTDAAAGDLPNYAIVTPTGVQSQHNSFSMAAGDNWVGQVVQRIESGPEWASTAIFITYDDCGCFYDHATPANASWGVRVPMVIVSPYAKAGYTDSVPATYASMLAYTEHVFNLTPLTQADRGAYAYGDSFAYSQTPLAAPPMVHTHISRTERSYVAAHSSTEGAT